MEWKTARRREKGNGASLSRFGAGASLFFALPPRRARPLTMPSSPVSLNVYDLHPVNDYLHWAGLGKRCGGRGERESEESEKREKR